ncbi:agrin [Parasteatoda tepidariorum]|nr:agrin [Parasteatoda tepidariorum]
MKHYLTCFLLKMMGRIQAGFVFIILLFCSVECRRRRFRDCPEERLKIREDQADVILTGTVKRLYGAQDGLYSGEVLVKRVIKGDYIKSGESLIVEGFGNPDICDSNGKIKDSKIFLLSQLQTGRFRLNSSMVQMNTANLEKITATVKGVPYRRRSPIAEEPCEKKFCKFHGDCFEENRRASCRCATNCKEHYNPVCGSDGLTYNTECQLRVESCRKKKKLYVRHEGLCLRTE